MTQHRPSTETNSKNIDFGNGACDSDVMPSLLTPEFTAGIPPAVVDTVGVRMAWLHHLLDFGSSRHITGREREITAVVAVNALGVNTAAVLRWARRYGDVDARSVGVLVGRLVDRGVLTLRDGLLDVSLVQVGAMSVAPESRVELGWRGIWLQRAICGEYADVLVPRERDVLAWVATCPGGVAGEVARGYLGRCGSSSLCATAALERLVGYGFLGVLGEVFDLPVPDLDWIAGHLPAPTGRGERP